MSVHVGIGSRAHIDQILRDTAAHVCVPCCANAIPVSPYEQQRVESDMLFHITRLEIEVNTLKGQLAAADEEIRRLRMVELRCMCAAGVAELVDEELISC